jgi:hypothetical protein
MKYEKPEITKLDNAISAVQNPQAKPGVEFLDGTMPHSLGTIGAYPADE